MNKNTLPKIPKETQKKFLEIQEIIHNFCNEHLNEEYQNLADKLLAKLSRKRPSPLLRGKSDSWAAGVVHALGMVNFVFDKSQDPYISAKALHTWFDLGESTVNGKSKLIRDMFKISRFDADWVLPSRMDNFTYIWMILVNGQIMDARKAPYEIQVAAYEQGAIPYIPDDKKLTG